MRLRPNLRPPQRLDSDLFYTPLSRRGLCASRNTKCPSYVDYNPNLPPAAFPTLEKPRTPEPSDEDQLQVKDNHCAKGIKRTRPVTCINNSYDKIGNRNKETNVDFGDIPMHMIENCVASNGDLNPIYVNNMARMAAAGSTSSFPDGEMEDSDQDEVGTGKRAKIERRSASLIRNSAWRDLSMRMQVEIFENLLQNYNWPAVRHVLGLTEQENETIKNLLKHREEQVELEDSQLNVMRAKQLRELLRIDNSSGDRSGIPSQLVFRKISRQSVCRLRDLTDLDYLTCETKELMNARRFLHRRGIDGRFAGEWSSSVTLLSAHEDDSVSEINEGPADELCLTATTSNSGDGHSVDQIQSALSTSTKEVRDLTPGKHGFDTSVQLLPRRSNEPREYNLIVRLKIGAERDARIGESETSYVQPTKLSLEPPSLHHSSTFLRTAPKHNAANGPSSDQAIPVTSVPSVQSTTRGNWLYAPIPLRHEPQTIFSSSRLPEKPAEVRQGTQVVRQSLVDQEDDFVNTFLDTPTSGSPRNTKGLFLSPTISESDPFTFPNLESARITVTNSIPSMNASRRESSNLPSGLSFSSSFDENDSRSMKSTGCSCQDGCYRKEEEEEDEEADPGFDEMILLPSSSGGSL